MAKHRKLSNARIKYICAIYELSGPTNSVRSIDIARRLNVTRPSVHCMVDRLISCGYAKQEYYGQVCLSERGQEVAKHYLLNA